MECAHYDGSIIGECRDFCYKRLLKNDTVLHASIKDKPINVLEPFVTGSVTGAVSAVTLCPSDVLKCRAQAAIVSGGQVCSS